VLDCPMRRADRSLFCAAFLTAALAVPLTADAVPLAGSAAGPSISDGQLLNDALPREIPSMCANAASAERTLSLIATPSADDLHTAALAYAACARSNFAKTHVEVFNRAVLATAAATLLASRREAGADAHRDAVFAARLSTAIRPITSATDGYSFQTVHSNGFENVQAVRSPFGNQATPSQYTTEATLIRGAAVAAALAEQKG
jgi:hypothetical protein